MTCWNYMTDAYKNCTTYASNFYNYLSNYHNTDWVFIDGHPLHSSYVSNEVETTFHYDSHKNILYKKLHDTKHKLPWLSARLCIYNENKTKLNMYDIDDFIETFTCTMPNLPIIFMCWCIYTKQWFSKSTVEFHIINQSGEELKLPVL